MGRPAEEPEQPERAAPPESVREFRELLREKIGVFVADETEAANRAEVTFNLSRLMNRMNLDFDALHRKNGHTWPGFRILNVLWAVGPAELRVIARLSGASRARIWSAVNTLEKHDFVRRDRDLSDRRLTWVSLTEHGRQSLDAAVLSQVDRERQWYSVLSPEDMAEFSRILEILADQKTPS